MPKSLGVPVPFTTPLGAGQATHEMHHLQITDSPSGRHIISTKVLAMKTSDNGFIEIPSLTRTVRIVGADAEGLGENPTLADIGAKHDVLDTVQKAAEKKAAEEHKANLQRQIKEAEARLKELRETSN